MQLGENMRPVAIIPTGYAVNDPVKRDRRPVEEISTFIGFDGKMSTQSNAPQRVKFEHADIGGALFNDLNLAGSELVNINMRGVSFCDVNMTDGKIEGCNLSNVEISDCILDGLKINGKQIADLISE